MGIDGHPELRALLRDLEARPCRRVPRLPGVVRAAVAIVLVPRTDELALVLIGRPVRVGDRWSGDVAFPGGLESPADGTGVDTARREAHEEVGLVLDDAIGSLSDRFTIAPGRRRPMRVRPLLFTLDALPPLVPDPREVAAVHVLTPSEIRSAEPRTIERRMGPRTLSFPGRVLGDQVLWGLTADLVGELERRIARGRRLSRG